MTPTIIVLYIAGVIGYNRIDAIDAVASAIAQRERIRTAHAKVLLERWQRDPADSFVPVVDMEVWQRPGTYRFDATKRGAFSLAANTGYRQVLCDNCVRPDHTVFADPGVSASVLDKLTPEARKRFLHRGIDLRMLGFVTRSWPNLMPEEGDNPYRPRLRFNLGNPDYPSPRLESRADGLITLQMSSVRDGTQQAVTVDPARQYAVTEIEQRITRKDDSAKVVVRYTNTYGPSATNGVWYPSRVASDVIVDGVSVERETYTITELSINTPLDQAAFTLAGIGVADGQSIDIPEDSQGRHVTWKGKIVRRDSVPELRERAKQAAVAAAPPPQPLAPAAVTAPATPWWYAAPAAVFAAVAVYFLRRLTARRG